MAMPIKSTITNINAIPIHSNKGMFFEKVVYCPVLILDVSPRNVYF
jgi:hypothetical protein